MLDCCQESEEPDSLSLDDPLEQDTPESLDEMLGHEGEEEYIMGKFEAKLEGLRDWVCEKCPSLECLIGGNYDIKIGIAQGIGSLVPTIAVNVAFALTPAATLSYLGIQAARYLSTVVFTAAAYAGVHYFMNDQYKGHVREMFSEAFKFTAIDRGAFLPTRALLFGLESLLVGAFGWSRYIVGNFVPLITTMQGFGTNFVGSNIKEGYTIGSAIKQGFKNMGKMLWGMVKAPYTLGKRAYDAIFHNEPEMPYLLDEPEEYILDWHEAMLASAARPNASPAPYAPH